MKLKGIYHFGNIFFLFYLYFNLFISDDLFITDPLNNYDNQYIYNCKLVSSIYDVLTRYNIMDGFIIYLHKDSISIVYYKNIIG